MKQKKENLKEARALARSKFIHPDGCAVFSFARQSSGDEVDSASISDQLEANRKAAQLLNMEITWEDWDANITGYSYPDTEYFRACYKLDLALQKYFSQHAATNCKPVFRDGLGFIFKQMQKGDILLLDTATRLVRATTIPTNESNLWNWLEMMEIKTFVGSKLYNPKDIGTKIISAVETQSKEEKAKNAIRGLKSAKDKGVLIGFHTLFGFEFSISRGQQILTPKAEEFSIVQKIFSDFLSGKGKNAICREINSLYPLKKWNTNTLNLLLNNPKYTGLTSNSNGALIECPAIQTPAVSKEVWEKAQLLQYQYKPKKEKHLGRIYLLTGLVRCGYCGGVMKPQANRSGRSDKYYICLKHASCLEPDTRCKGSALIDTNEKQQGMESIMEYFGMLYFLRGASSKELTRKENEIEELEKQYTETACVLKSMEETLTHNFLLFETLKPALEEAAKKKQELCNEIKWKKIELKETEIKWNQKKVHTTTLNEWKRFPIAEKQKIIRQVICKIHIYEDCYIISLKDGSSVSLPKYLHGKRLFNPEIHEARVSSDHDTLFLTLKAPFGKRTKKSILYESDRMKIYYLFS